MTRTLVGLLLALTATSAVLGWYAYRQLSARAAAEARLEAAAETIRAQQAALVKNRALSARRAQESAAAKRESASLRDRLAAAQRVERTWADQPIPDSIKEALKCAQSPASC